jgi:hypothetical protein
MSSTANHKKVLKIIREACNRKGLLRDIFFIIGEDQPSAIANAYDKLMEEERPKRRMSGDNGTSGVSPGYGPWHRSDLWQCPECKKFVSKLGIAGACIKCDPRGFDHQLS